MLTDRVREQHRVRTAEKRDKHKKKLVEHFGDKCHDCGQSFPICCYDFHHENPEEKSFELAPNMGKNYQMVLEEASKCVMLCSNCHRVRHWVPKDYNVRDYNVSGSTTVKHKR